MSSGTGMHLLSLILLLVHDQLILSILSEKEQKIIMTINGECRFWNIQQQKIKTRITKKSVDIFQDIII